MVESEALLQLGHLTGEGRWVCGAAGEDLDCHRTAVAGAEQPIDDLPFAAFAVTAVTELGERAATAFQVARPARAAAGHCRAGARGCPASLVDPVRRPSACSRISRAIRPVSVARVSAGSSGHAGVSTIVLGRSSPNRSSCCAGPSRLPIRFIRRSVLLTGMGLSSILVARGP